MGGFFGAVSKTDCSLDVFFGVDYHSHLGTICGGMAMHDADGRFSRSIHNIQNTPFRTKFEPDLPELAGNAGIGCISDTDPQPVLIRSHWGTYAITTVGRVSNLEELTRACINKNGGHFSMLDNGRINTSELVAAIINQYDSFAEGIRQVQEQIDGTMSILILTEQGEIIAARDLVGRLPVSIGKKEGAMCASFEPFAYQKLDYEMVKELGPGEIVKLSPDGYEVLMPAREQMKICGFLWTYYGYPNATYEGVNVEQMRYRDGALLAKQDRELGLVQNLDYVCGVPDSGVPNAIGYANESHLPFARAFIKYTPTWPRSFMPTQQSVRNQVARMKQILVRELIHDKKLLFVDDSIVRGTQLRETADLLHEYGAKELHMRSACPPIMYGCKYLNFSRNTSDNDLIARRTILDLEGPEGEQYIAEYADPKCERGRCLRETIGKQLHLTTLEYQSLPNLLTAIGLDSCKVCTYCWSGKE